MNQLNKISGNPSYLGLAITNGQVWPMISIVTPSYNQGAFIEETLLSVKRQDYPNFEHIVIDAMSTDGTVQILNKYRDTYDLRIVREPDNGQSEAVNKGVRLSNGEIIGWLNSDDVYFSVDVFKKVAGKFSANREVDVIYSNRLMIDKDSNLIRLEYSRDFDYSKLRKAYFGLHQESVFFRRRVLEQNGLDPKLKVMMDSELWLRLGTRYCFKYMNDIFGCIRVHGSNKSTSPEYYAVWNDEKQYVIKKYNTRRYMVGKGFPWRRLINQMRAALSGGYNNYYRLPTDILRLFSYPQDMLAFPLKIDRKAFFTYLLASVTPRFT